MSNTNNATNIVLVHGGWADGSGWSKQKIRKECCEYYYGSMAGNDWGGLEAAIRNCGFVSVSYSCSRVLVMPSTLLHLESNHSTT